MIKAIIVAVAILLLAWFIRENYVAKSVAGVSANELTALGSCKTIFEAANTYYQVNNEYPKNLEILSLAKPPYIAKDLARGIRKGYKYFYEITKTGFFLTATPIEMDKTGRFYFHLTENKKILVCDKERNCVSEEDYLRSLDNINRSALIER